MDDLPPKIRKAKALLLEALRLLQLHGRMRVRRWESHRGVAFIFRIVIPIDDATSARDLKRESIRKRG